MCDVCDIYIEYTPTTIFYIYDLKGYRGLYPYEMSLMSQNVGPGGYDMSENTCHTCHTLSPYISPINP